MKKKTSNPDACYKYNPPNCFEQDIMMDELKFSFYFLSLSWWARLLNDVKIN